MIVVVCGGDGSGVGVDVGVVDDAVHVDVGGGVVAYLQPFLTLGVSALIQTSFLTWTYLTARNLRALT